MRTKSKATMIFMVMIREPSCIRDEALQRIHQLQIDEFCYYYANSQKAYNRARKSKVKPS